MTCSNKLFMDSLANISNMLADAAAAECYATCCRQHLFTDCLWQSGLIVVALIVITTGLISTRWSVGSHMEKYFKERLPNADKRRVNANGTNSPKTIWNWLERKKRRRNSGETEKSHAANGASSEISIWDKIEPIRDTEIGEAITGGHHFLKTGTFFTRFYLENYFRFY